jgi:ribonuclease-3 family protein
MLIGGNSEISEEKAAQMPPLVLAYLGDTVYDMYVRTKLALDNKCGAGALHSMSVGIVNARAQAEFARSLESGLNGLEKDVFRRARNAKRPRCLKI